MWVWWLLWGWVSAELKVCSLVPGPLLPSCPAGFQCSFRAIGLKLNLGAGPSLDQNSGLCVPCDSTLACPPGTIRPFSNHCSTQDPSRRSECIAGEMCVSKAVLNLVPLEVNGVLLDGLCVRCAFGSYCPQGTINPFFLARVTLCPRGQVCPSPARITDCPQGSFCVEGFSTAIECKTPGTFCPERSPEPQRCPPGSFCPDPSTKKPCPRGSYCREFYTHPVVCPLLSRCPEGSIGPEATVLILVCLVLVVVPSLAFLTYFHWVYRFRSNQDTKKLGLVLKTVDVLKVLIRNLGVGNGDVYQFQGFKKHENRVTLGFRDLGLVIGNNKSVLKGVSGEFRHSRVVAVMGPSGSGKSVRLLHRLSSESLDFSKCFDGKGLLWESYWKCVHQWKA